MPFTVQHLIEGRGEPVTARPEESASEALERMIEHDFSQLPVIDENNTVCGVVTSDSLARAVNNLGVPLSALHVADALDRKPEVRADDDLFDVLDDLGRAYAVLIVDAHRHLQGIVTSYDAMDYFRRRAQDTMVVEDIELMLRDLIRAAFTDGEGTVQQSQLDEAIETVTDPTRGLADRFESGLRHYLRLQSADDKPVSLNRESVVQAFGRIVDRAPSKSFERLTLREFTELIVNKTQWSRFSALFNLDAAALRRMLDGVRETRNDLAHFRGQISAMQRDQLRYCAQWLAYHLTFLQKRELTQPSTVTDRNEAVHVSHVSSGAIADIAVSSPAPTTMPGDSRYAPLADYLSGLPGRTDKMTLSFKQIEEIIGGDLPPSAREHRAFWANDSTGHVQSQLWLDAGWRVGSVSMSDEQVSFARISERRRAYIDFFSAFLHELQHQAPFATRSPNPDGSGWFAVAGLPTNSKQVAQLIFGFARNKHVRVYLYIDTGEYDRTKAIFDALYAHRDEINAEMQVPLDWDRLDRYRASQVSVWHSGSIGDSHDDLTQLQAWAIQTMVALHDVIGRHLAAVVAPNTAGHGQVAGA